MKEITYDYVDGSIASDQTQAQSAAENAKKLIRVFNEIMSDCEKQNIIVDFRVIEKNSTKQNYKLSLNEIKQIL